MERDRLDICIASPGMPHDGSTLATKSLGGSETASIYLANALAKRGHFVTVFSPGHQGSIHGSPPVMWRPYEEFVPYCGAMPHDVTLITRDVGLLKFRYHSKLLGLWCHDLAHKQNRIHVAGALWNMNHIVVLSEFQKRQYLGIYDGCPESLFVVARNGVNLASTNAAIAKRPKRDMLRLLYASRPERGLEIALAIVEELRRKGLPVTLSVTTYENVMVPDQAKAYYAMLDERMAQMPWVTRHGNLKQPDLHRLMATSAALIYPGAPGEFREISCIVAMEAQACGLPVVAIGQGALPETLGWEDSATTPGGLTVGGEETNPATPAFVTEFGDVVATVLKDQDLWSALHQAGIERAGKRFGWDGVAELMEAEWVGRLNRQSGDARRLRLHLNRIGDHEAAALMEESVA